MSDTGAPANTAGSCLRYGMALAIVICAIDQALKLWLVFGYQLGARGVVPVLPFVDLVLVWNQGISYGLFQQDTAAGRAILLTVTLVATGLLIWWLRHTTERFPAAGLGLLIGGALGNGIDRAAYGAVVDFILLHAPIGGREIRWYVFNIADAAIVLGVLIILWDGFRPRRAAKAP